jgi:metal-sulfur cluster biosynthetic enzyme
MSNRDILTALHAVIDPELGLSIVDLGLVYRADWTPSGIAVAMTVTSRTCPIGDALVAEAKAALHAAFPETPSIMVDLVWDPPWSPERMTAEGRRQLGWPEPAGAAPERAARGNSTIKGWRH